ncbi:hypothetical protein PF005_g6065 [Phytophthora fragariae]|uniref:Uncharacterized protein n=1 Tax=Phytophthora fragariae TaxID=53985 RepID=A0A6A3TA93_9STRA|nr:hypothetical protein PF003_g11826 [Phytophthora fragariae]KAE8943825.1 hypothetical protein PF009_g6459 [Phytophthora fragariae]KAE9020634.1 hypothetical protein PF011_g5328 [Phytophthora fragariae]KAE9126237.1 hypothetical protein PF010_g5327 [Phytophthora fragariae]KAE9132415.1 hypothetical protein PF007_g3735 [Phytophthora fragariae]
MLHRLTRSLDVSSLTLLTLLIADWLATASFTYDTARHRSAAELRACSVGTRLGGSLLSAHARKRVK